MEDSEEKALIASVKNAAINGYGTGPVVPRPEPSARVYKVRWYILLLFFLFNATMMVNWNSWSTVAGPAEVAFQWTDATVATMNNLGCIATVVSAVFFSWLIVTKGFRVAIVANTFCVCLASGLRCISRDPGVMRYTAIASATINGFSSLAPGGAAALSSLWFPANERISATSVGSAGCYVGVATSYLLGPYIVEDPFLNITNSTSNSTSIEDVEKARDQIMEYLYILAGWSGAIFLLTLLYFPAKPKLPPSSSATLPRFDFKAGVVSLMKNCDYWRVMIPYLMTLGCYVSWSALLDVNLKSIQISQTTAGWIGFFGICATAVGSFTSARINDYLGRQIKTSLLILTFCAGGMFLWFALMMENVIPPSIVQFYCSGILAAFFVGGMAPLYFEMVCENAYPTPEAVSGGVQIMLSNATATIFFFVFLIPDIGVKWMNWAQFGVTIPSFVMLSLLKPKYARLNTDDNDVGGEINNSASVNNDLIA